MDFNSAFCQIQNLFLFQTRQFRSRDLVCCFEASLEDLSGLFLKVGCVHTGNPKYMV